MDRDQKLSRLTEREKECLRAWLDHKSAKEIALELGISHHAVEKRLKMARIKLDVGSSIDAARLLGEAEGYGQTVAKPADLPRIAASDQRSRFRKLELGALIMILATAVTLALLVQGGGDVESPSAEADGGSGGTAQDSKGVYEAIENGEERSIDEFEFVKASPERVRAYVRQEFDGLDKDGSGFIELEEAPLRLAEMEPRPADEPIRLYRKEDVAKEWHGPAAQREYIAMFDDDDDGRVSFEEYAEPVMPHRLQRGIPLIPADWSAPRSEAAKPD
jgi:DNA-binding CsgD family transcriptional regulator/Ca2+-binding EF-hand superfamily protein